jgi:hypothetical protein
VGQNQAKLLPNEALWQGQLKSETQNRNSSLRVSTGTRFSWAAMRKTQGIPYLVQTIPQTSYPFEIGLPDDHQVKNGEVRLQLLLRFVV